MKGDERVRHCSLCKLNVYNLSGMNEADAEQLLASQTGRMCVRYYQRPDGKVMTKDCPKGIRALRQKAMQRFALAASLVLSAIGCGEQGGKIKEATGLGILDKEEPVQGRIVSCPPVMMGAIAPTPLLPKATAPTNSPPVSKVKGS